jgi:hypothetical protein
MAKQLAETNEANTKAFDKLNQALAKMRSDLTVKAVHHPYTIFKYHLGALICQNCGYTNPPDQDSKDPPACIECGLTHQINVFVGPFEKPDYSVPDTTSEALAQLDDVSTTSDNGEQQQTS